MFRAAFPQWTPGHRSGGAIVDGANTGQNRFSKVSEALVRSRVTVSMHYVKMTKQKRDSYQRLVDVEDIESLKRGSCLDISVGLVGVKVSRYVCAFAVANFASVHELFCPSAMKQSPENFIGLMRKGLVSMGTHARRHACNRPKKESLRHRWKDVPFCRIERRVSCPQQASEQTSNARQCNRERQRDNQEFGRNEQREERSKLPHLRKATSTQRNSACEQQKLF